LVGSDRDCLATPTVAARKYVGDAPIILASIILRTYSGTLTPMTCLTRGTRRITTIWVHASTVDATLRVLARWIADPALVRKKLASYLDTRDLGVLAH
jgi:hypothetical protein